MILYALVHSHKYGNEFYPFFSNKHIEKLSKVKLKKLIKTFEIEFEPELDEHLDLVIMRSEQEQIPVI